MKAARLAPTSAALVLMACAVQAQTQAPAADQTIVVTGAVRQQAQDDAPYAITAVEREALRSAGPMINLSEALARVPVSHGTMAAARSAASPPA